jgi:hypothetical protein
VVRVDWWYYGWTEPVNFLQFLQVPEIVFMKVRIETLRIGQKALDFERKIDDFWSLYRYT